MNNPDVNAESRLLLGTVGWNRPGWDVDYYPEDLPDDWRLAFLANDCDCVLLPPDAWLDLDSARASQLEAALADVPGSLVFFLQLRSAEAPSSEALARFEGWQSILLADETVPARTFRRPVWSKIDDAVWVGQDGARLVVWTLNEVDLRALRAQASALSDRSRVVLLDGPAASPTVVRQLRTLFQLLGIA